MVFSSFVFLCIFLPVVLVLHTCIKNTTLRNALLIVASLLFYGYGEPKFIILLVVSSFMNYLFGLAVAKNRSKMIVALAAIVNLGLLVVFKYLGLFTTTINSLIPGGNLIPVIKIALPIGISFYTFQALSYVIDVYRGDTEVQRNFAKLLLYISFFPQLIAGPIVKYHDIDIQLTDRNPSFIDIRNGIFRFCVGLAKKVLISNSLAFVADSLFNNTPLGEISFASALLAGFTYMMQIYFDFSGYSDMAIGLGRMFGFHFLENFNHPYISDSIQEFWRRWHISLSSYFREYLYIPLGGNRKGARRTYINRYIVFAATGIWHGANWTFLVWGLFHGTFLVLESSGLLPIKKCKIKAVRCAYTLILVMIGFIMFRADNITQGLYYIKALFGFGSSSGIGFSYAMQFVNLYYVMIYILAIIGCTELPIKLYKKIMKFDAVDEMPVAAEIISMVLCVVAILLSFMSLASASYNPFIYFRF